MAKNVFWELTEGELEQFHKSLDDELLLMPLPLDKLRMSELIIAARVDDRVVGIAGIRKHRCLPMVYFVVNRDYQGRGLGKRLAEQLTERARTRGYRLVALTVDSSNTRAFHIYRDAGYITVFRTRNKKLMIRRL